MNAETRKSLIQKKIRLFRARLKNNFENRKHKNIEKLLEFHISRKIDKYTVNIETTNFI